jgi:hypothetical protein
MKNFLVVSVALVLLPVAAWPQALSDNPAPAPFDPRWNHIERLSDGQRIVVLTTNGAKVSCRFAGATDTFLFCDQPGVLSSQPDFRFDRASVVSVRESQPEHNWHPGLLAALAVVGTGWVLPPRGTWMTAEPRPPAFSQQGLWERLDTGQFKCRTRI